MSAETVTFQNINLYAAASGQPIYDIGAKNGGTGVIQEIAAAFEYDLTPEPDVDNLGGLIGEVGPAKELQNNIGRVQDVLGTDENAFEIARGWVKRSGLLLPVERGYLDPDEEPIVTEEPRIILMSDGVRNWMQRRADTLLEGAVNTSLDTVILGAGTRAMNPAEGPDVEKGMTAADYMQDVIAPRIAGAGLRTEVVITPSEKGDQVMDAMVFRIHALLEDDSRYADADMNNLPDMLMVSNAGAWAQNAGQLRRALARGLYPHHVFEFDELGNSFFVTAGGIKLGETGNEPKETHQNPLTALGMILRGAQEMLRHIDH